MTDISDTGIGIDQKRQKNLFRIFGELFDCQSISKVKDHSIGLGLTCSAMIANKLNG